MRETDDSLRPYTPEELAALREGAAKTYPSAMVDHALYSPGRFLATIAQQTARAERIETAARALLRAWGYTDTDNWALAMRDEIRELAKVLETS